MLALSPSWFNSLKSPPGWPVERAWPPSVRDAEALVESGGAGDAVGRKASYESAGARPYERSRSNASNPGRVLALAAATAAEGSPGSLLRAHALFRTVAGYSRGAMRGVALHNAAVVLSRVKARPLLALAEATAKNALALADAPVDELRRMILDIHDDLMGLQHPVPLVWSGTRLVTISEHARDRIASVPAGGLEGPWSDVRVGLLVYGLASPEKCALRSPVVAVPAAADLAIDVTRAASPR